MPRAAPASESVLPCRLLRVRGGQLEFAEDQLAVEEPLETEICFQRRGATVRKSVGITMRTPGQDEELVTGSLLTEGWIGSRSDIAAFSVAPCTVARHGPATRATVQLARPVQIAPRGKRLTTASCGACAQPTLQSLNDLPLPAREAACASRLRPNVLHRLPFQLREAQTAFEQTGGLHAAGLFDFDGKLLAVREDVGRHNAVDKVLGAALLADLLPLRTHVLLVSGRISFELVQKASVAGAAVLAAIGAPSSLARDTAARAGIALVGFLGAQRFNLYTGAETLLFDERFAASAAP